MFVRQADEAVVLGKTSEGIAYLDHGVLERAVLESGADAVWVGWGFVAEDVAFAELCERDGIIPAPYLAKAKWVGLQRFNALEDREYKELVPRAYELVRAKLTKKAQAGLAEAGRRRTALDGTAGLETGRSKTTSRRPARRASGTRSSRR